MNPSPTREQLMDEVAELRRRLELAEKSSVQSKDLFSVVVEQAPMGVYVVDHNFRLQQVNARALPAFAKVDARVGRDFSEVMEILWGPEVGKTLSGIFRKTLATGEPYVSPRFSELRHDLGEERAYEWETRRVTLPNGEHGVVCYFNDVTENSRTEQALRNSEAHYRTIGESINYGVWICAPDGRNLYASESFLKLVGLTQEECSNFGWGSVLHPDDLEHTISAWQECVRTGASWDREHRFRGVDNKWHYVLARGMPVRDAAGKIVSWVGINLDIGRLKHAEQALRDSEERAHLATEATGVGIWEWNIKTNEIRWDSQIFRIYGLEPTKDGIASFELWKARVHPEDYPRQAELLLQTIKSGTHDTREFRIFRPGETEPRQIQAVDAVRRNAQGEPEWLVGTNLDVTDRRRVEKSLVEAKAAAEAANQRKDRFLATLSHELRTPLTPVLITAETLRDNQQLPPDVREQMGMIERNIALESRLLEDLFDLTAVIQGKLKLRQEPFDAHSLISLTIEIVRDEAAIKNINLACEFKAAESHLVADPARFQQVIWNLLRNAVKFTPPSGKITIGTSNILGKDGKTRLQIQVTDTGIGIEPAALGEIFLPFEQSRTAGNHQFGGLGLGLAIAKGIIDQHTGRIWAASDGLDRGAVFTVELPTATPPPRSQTETATTANHAKQVNPPKATLRRLLLVEDHGPTLLVLSNLLKNSGYVVITASKVAEALDAAAKQKFDLVISDLGLPDGTGIQLMEQLRQKHGLRGIALSGYGMEEDIQRTKEAGFAAHLVKPVRIAELRKALATFS